MAADHNEELIEKLNAMEERYQKAQAEVTRLSEQLETECQHEVVIIRLTVRNEALTEAFCNLMNTVNGAHHAASKAYDKINEAKPATEPQYEHTWQAVQGIPRCSVCGQWDDGGPYYCPGSHISIPTGFDTPLNHEVMLRPLDAVVSATASADTVHCESCGGYHPPPPHTPGFDDGVD